MDIEREAIIIYLNNMRIIETIIHQSERSKIKLESELQNKEKNIVELKNKSNFDVNCSNSSAFGTGIGTAFFTGFVGLVIGFVLEKIDNVMGYFRYIGDYLTLIGVILGAIIGFVFGMISTKNYNKKATAKNIAYKEQLQSELHSAQSEYDQKVPVIEHQISNLEAEISRLKDLRDEGYNMNIIPYSSSYKTNLRTLEGVMSLYEFMSSSRQSFSEAILHNKLDTIISQLSYLISKVETIARQGAVTMMQQEKMLLSMKNNEKHLEAIKDYNEIIAHNSKLQTEMAHEALFYDRVRFFSEL